MGRAENKYREKMIKERERKQQIWNHAPHSLSPPLLSRLANSHFLCLSASRLPAFCLLLLNAGLNLEVDSIRALRTHGA